MAAFVAASCGRSPTSPKEGSPAPPDPPKPGWLATIDFPQAWSHDGRLVAFRRVIESPIGPPGIYVMPARGGQPRFLTPADFFWPKGLRFSPDARQLVGIDRCQVVIIDVATGAKRYPIGSAYFITWVDWSPDGGRLIYCEVRGPYVEEPSRDSVGIHVLDLTTGVTSPSFRYQGDSVEGQFVKWSPDGERFVLDQSCPESGYRQIAVYSLVDSTKLAMTEAVSMVLYDNVQWLHAAPGEPECLAFMQQGPGGGGTFLYFDGHRERWARGIAWTDVFSRDGSYVLTTDVDPVDRLGVLHVLATQRARHVKDPHRQLTSWRGPAPP